MPCLRRRLTATIVFGGAAVALTVFAQSGAQTPPPQQPGRPTFRSGVDIARTTVRVIDKDRRPIRDLTEKDFTVFVNGVKQPIVAVVADEEPGPIVPTAPWMRDVAPDVATNNLVDPRLVVIIMDDVTDKDIPVAKSKASPYQMAQARLVARTILDELGPNDLASIVFSGDNRGPQDFTGDRTRLLAAVDRYHPTELRKETAIEYQRNVIQHSIEFLRQAPERRSAIFWISDTFLGPEPDILPPSVPPAPGTTKANQSFPTGSTSVPVYTISTIGFTGGVPGSGSGAALPAVTGGRAISQTNTPAVEVPAVFQELNVAYTIGFQQTPPESDGRFRRVQVRVNRPDVIILPADLGYFPPNAKSAAKADLATRAGNPTTLALSGLVALPDEPLRLAVAPFAAGDSTNGSLARVAVALGVDVPFESGRIGDTIDLEMRVFDAEGRKQVDERRDTQVLRPRGGRDRGEFEMLSTLSLKPGRYNIRASMYSALRESAGSVYTDFVVPDFENAVLALSGLVVSTVPDKPSMPAGEFRAWLPTTPTTTRAFGRADLVTVFLRAYTGGGSGASPVAVRAEIRDANDRVVFTKADTLVPAREIGPPAADYRLRLPLDTLPAGAYLLTVTASGPAEAEARRDLRFSVR